VNIITDDPLPHEADVRAMIDVDMAEQIAMLRDLGNC
jgi:hypothetical protein